MAEYRCETCGIRTQGNIDEPEFCPVCEKEMKGMFRRKNCSLNPAEQLGGARELRL